MRRPIHEITFSNDGALATVHTRVDEIFRSFLDDIPTECSSDEEKFELHLKIIIWGVLHIEGLVNYKLYLLTAKQFGDSPLLPAYWNLTKQAKLDEKLSLIFSADGVKRPWLRAALKRFTKLVEERNRLVHFKDIPTEFQFAELRTHLPENAPLLKWFDHVPNPKIVSDLLSVSLKERKDLLQLIGSGLEDVRVG